MSPLEWMAWTTPTAVFFVAVAAMLVTMTLISLRWPSLPRKGVLPMPTTRGERLYIGLLGIAFIFLVWMGVTDATLAGAAGISLLWLILVLRWG